MFDKLTFKFATKDLNKNGRIEDVSYPVISSPLMFEERSIKAPKLRGRRKEAKSLSISYRLLNPQRDYRDNKTTRKLAEKLVADCYSQDVHILRVGDKYAWAILNEANITIDNNTALIDMDWVLVDGRWMTNEFTSEVNKDIFYESIEDSDECKIFLKANKNKITIKHKKDIIEIDQTSGDYVVDLKKGIVTKGNDYVPVSLDSNFFQLERNKKTKIEVDGATGKIVYRGIVL